MKSEFQGRLNITKSAHFTIRVHGALPDRVPSVYCVDLSEHLEQQLRAAVPLLTIKVWY